jgi:hypothetical protein
LALMLQMIQYVLYFTMHSTQTHHPPVRVTVTFFQSQDHVSI